MGGDHVFSQSNSIGQSINLPRYQSISSSYLSRARYQPQHSDAALSRRAGLCTGGTTATLPFPSLRLPSLPVPLPFPTLLRPSIHDWPAVREKKKPTAHLALGTSGGGRGWFFFLLLFAPFPVELEYVKHCRKRKKKGRRKKYDRQMFLPSRSEMRVEWNASFGWMYHSVRTYSIDLEVDRLRHRHRHRYYHRGCLYSPSRSTNVHAVWQKTNLHTVFQHAEHNAVHP